MLAVVPNRDGRATSTQPTPRCRPGAYEELPIMEPLKLREPPARGLVADVWYDGRTVEMKRLLADMVDSLPAANRDLCPYCSLDTNPELDHFLPKAKFPEFSLHGRNLFPICGPCNRCKLNRIKSVPGGERYFLFPRLEPALGPVLEAELTFAAAKVCVAWRNTTSNKTGSSDRVTRGIQG